MAQNGTGRMAEAYRLFFEALREPGTDRIMRAAYSIFGCPVLFVDEYFHVVSMVPSGRIGDPDWDYIAEHKSMNREKVWALLDEFLSGKEEFYSVFYANTGSCEKCPRIFGEVVRDDMVAGHVMVFLREQPLRPEDLSIVSLLLDAIKIKIDSRTKGMSRWNLSLSTKLQDLLDPMTPPHLHKLACEALKSSMAPEYAICATPVGQQASQRAFAEYALYQLQQRYHNMVAVIYENTIITLYGDVKRRSNNGNLTPEESEFTRTLMDYFASHDMVSGVSNCFSDIAETRIHYRQALLAAQMSLKLNLGEHALFMDLMPLPIFLSVLENEKSETFVHPAIYAMQAYDAEHGTDYYRTMRLFSMTMHNKDRTASMLNVHRNTLLYRLGRISELFDLPYEDDKVALNVLCSYLILELGEYGTREQLDNLLGSNI